MLFVVNDSWFFASHRLPIAKELLDQGYKVHLLARDDSSRDAILDAGVKMHDWRLSPRGTCPIQELKALWNVYNTFREVSPDIVHLVTIKSVLYGGLVSRMLRMPSVVFAISGLGHLFGNHQGTTSLLARLSRKIYRFVLGHGNSVVIVQNKSDYSFFRENFDIPQQRLVLLPGSGVDLELFTPKLNMENTPRPRIVLAARMLWDKGVGVFVTAAEQLHEMGMSCEFMLVGYSDSDNPRSVSHDQLQKWSEKGIVQWLGHNDNMPELLQSTDIFCLPTTYGEGLPKVVIEAAACACSIVVSDWPGCNEIIINNENGLLVEPGSVEELVKALVFLIENPSERIRLGEQARATAERGYSVEVVVQRTIETYRGLEDSAIDRCRGV